MVKKILFAIIAVALMTACSKEDRREVTIDWQVHADEECQLTMLDSVCYLVAQEKGLDDNITRYEYESFRYGQIMLDTKNQDVGKEICAEYIEEVNRRVLAIEGLEESDKDSCSCMIGVECSQVVYYVVPLVPATHGGHEIIFEKEYYYN